MNIGIDLKHKGTSVPVSWCLGKEELNKLVESQGEAYLLLLVAPLDSGHEGYFKEARYFVPVQKKMEYVDFCTPGKHRIFSTVVWGNRCKNLKKSFMEKGSNGAYSRSFYNPYDDKLVEGDFNACGFGIRSFEVDFPKEAFAKEPPAWEKKWVNLFWGGKSADQCHYRKKRIFAYSFQLVFFPPILLAIELASWVIISALLLFGIKGIGFRKILHPFSEPFSSIWDETKGSVFGEHLPLRLLPSIFLGSCVTTWVICRIFGFQIVGFKSIWEAIIIGGAATGAAVVASGLIVISYYGLIKAINKIRNALISEERRERKIRLKILLEEERIKKIQERLQAEYALLACDGNFSASLKNLPPEKRTIHLSYKNLKSRMCKSFAR